MFILSDIHDQKQALQLEQRLQNRAAIQYRGRMRLMPYGSIFDADMSGNMYLRDINNQEEHHQVCRFADLRVASIGWSAKKQRLSVISFKHYINM